MQSTGNVLGSYLLGKLTDQLPQKPLFINKSSAYHISPSIRVQPRHLHVS